MFIKNIGEAIIFSDKVIVLTKRPCEIKSVYDIKLKYNESINRRRQSPEYNYYFNSIWKDLELDE